MYRPRTLQRDWTRLSRQFPALLLTGPRQVGKSTMLAALASSRRRYVSLDDATARELARTDPALFFQQHPPPVIVDEIQYAPQLLPQIKLIIDRVRNRASSGWPARSSSTP